jgi:RNA polymerase sigma-70 factor (ECF subfamily)
MMVRPVEPAAWQADLALVQRCRAGQVEAQRALFRDHFARVYATLHRITGTAHEAEDLAQDAFFEAFRSLHTFAGRARFSTWLDAIVVRVAFRHLQDNRRSARLHLVGPGDDEAWRSPDPERAMMARAGIRRLYAILDTLSPGTRLAFALHVFEGRAMAQVAGILGVPVVTAKLRVWRARKSVEAAARDDEILARYLGRKATPGEVP